MNVHSIESSAHIQISHFMGECTEEDLQHLAHSRRVFICRCTLDTSS